MPSVGFSLGMEDSSELWGVMGRTRADTTFV